MNRTLVICFITLGLLACIGGARAHGQPATSFAAAGWQISHFDASTPAQAAALAPLPPATSTLSAFNIVLAPSVALRANTGAMAAFERAALAWEAYFSDPIVITIDADFAALAPNTIGQASTMLLMGSYSEIRDQLVLDSLTDPDDLINAYLPTDTEFTAILPTGFSLTGNIVAAKGNLKAMGFEDLDRDFGISDAMITFNNLFAFDFDNSDGVTLGQIDFETVAIHEIGHSLGFFSVVDEVDFLLSQSTPGAVSPRPLDLFRFRNNDMISDPETAARFTLNSRDLTPGMSIPGAEAITDFVLPIPGGAPIEELMSTGLSTGDGRQASHWKDDAFTGENIGVMDPTLISGVRSPIRPSDVRALDLIGYDATIPEPGSLAMLAAGLFLLATTRPRPSRP